MMKKVVADQHYNWITVRDFLFESGCLIAVVSLVVWGLGFELYRTGRDTDSREALRYKELVYLHAAGRSYTDTDINDIDFQKDLSWASQVGSYFRSEHKKGVSPDKILEEYQTLKSKYEKLTDRNERGSLLNLWALRGVSAPLLSMVTDWRWERLAKSKEDLVTLQAVLKGEIQPVRLEHKKLPYPWKKILLWWLISSQFLSYFIGMIKFSGSRHISFNDALNLGQFRTYVVFLLVSPGAWPLFVINPVVIHFIHFFQTLNIRKKQEKDRIRMTVPELGSYSGQALADKLKQRMRGA